MRDNPIKRMSAGFHRFGHSMLLRCFFLLPVLLISCGDNPVKETVIPTGDKVGASMLPDRIEPVVNAPFEVVNFTRPVFPDLTIDISQRGAKTGESITLIVNQAIEEVSKNGGGTVVIPAGKWISERIVLKSNVNLHIAEGAEVEFGGNVEDYLPAVFTRHEGIEIMGAGAFIYANGENNIAITGKGTLYGPPMDAEIRERPNGNTVVENDVPMDVLVEQRVYDGMEGRVFYKPKSISPINCTNVLIEGVTLERSTFWNICPIYCENVIIRGVTVNSIGVPSGDGIDIESCKDVLIEYCTLNNGDDCFTIKAGRAEDGLRVGKPSENIVIRHSLAKTGHGAITCGSETAGGIRNVYAHDCVFVGTERGIRFKTRRNRGGGIENVFCERIRMVDVDEAIAWDLLGSTRYVGDLARRLPVREVDELTPVVKDIHIKDFVVESTRYFVRAQCIPEIPLKNVLIENGDINCDTTINTMDDVTGFTMRNLSIKSKTSTIKILEGEDIVFDNVRFSYRNRGVESK